MVNNNVKKWGVSSWIERAKKDASNEYLTLVRQGRSIGWELQRSLAPVGNLIAHWMSRQSFAVILAIGVAETVRKLRPDVIVNAAHTAVDKSRV